MAGFDYTRIRTSAHAKLKKYGMTATLRREVKAGGDEWNPAPPTVEDRDIVALLGSFSERMIDGITVKYGDRRVYVGADALGDFVPTVEDKLVLGAIEYAIINVLPIAPGGVPVMYEIQARGAGI